MYVSTENRESIQIDQSALYTILFALELIITVPSFNITKILTVPASFPTDHIMHNLFGKYLNKRTLQLLLKYEIELSLHFKLQKRE
jgi:hypothetical protein